MQAARPTAGILAWTPMAVAFESSSLLFAQTPEIPSAIPPGVDAGNLVEPPVPRAS